MLSQTEKREIEEEIARSYDRRAACVPAMRIIQRRRRWVSDEAIRDLSEILEMTRDELEAVAGFYNLIFRHPVGEHVLKVCDGAVCYMLGTQRVMDYLQEKLDVKVGETTADGKFTLLPICCVGDCDHAPVMMYDDTVVRSLTPEVIDRVLKGGPEAKG